jgi:hypothetical protein
MKTFSDLLATKASLAVDVNGTVSYMCLFDTLVLDATKPATVNGIEVLPKYRYLAQDGVLTIPSPFYSWYHEISGQGWLLIPDNFSQ